MLDMRLILHVVVAISIYDLFMTLYNYLLDKLFQKKTK